MFFDLYEFMFQFLPQNYILARYVGSLSLRLIFIISALGLMYYKNIFRKAIMIACLYTIITVYWKHPYEALINFDRYFNFNVMTFNQSLYAHFRYKFLDYYYIKKLSIIVAYVIDITLYGSIIFYLNRKKVKKYFI
ncbi:MAG: hypothetical protein KKD07_06185 [Candidatus Omnitrophica bacterium]|nr:hypothetical protein [Candidatus Omnitrophota bacterium]